MTGAIEQEREAFEKEAVEPLRASLIPIEHLVSMCEGHGDFSNGVTDPTGTIDEGAVRASEIISNARRALAALSHSAPETRIDGPAYLDPRHGWVECTSDEALDARSRGWKVIDAHFAPETAPAEPVAWQWQHLIGNPGVMKPFWTEWELCTKREYDYALATPDYQGRELFPASRPSAPVVESPEQPSVHQSEAVAQAVQRPVGGDGWIAVTERRPMLDVPVFALEGDRIVFRLLSADSDGTYWCNPYNSMYHDGKTWHAEDAEFDDDYKVTHWMPLPAPPPAAREAFDPERT